MVKHLATDLNELIYIFYSGYSGSIELEEPLVKKILILPYPDEADNEKLFFYKFERGKYFKEYLEAMNEIKFSKIKQLILNGKK